MIKGLIALIKFSRDATLVILGMYALVWCIGQLNLIDPMAFHTALRSEVANAKAENKAYTDARIGDLKTSIDRLDSTVDGMHKTVLEIYREKK